MNETKENNKPEVSSRELEMDMLWYINELLEFIEDKDITFSDALLENMLQFDDEYCKVAYEAIKTIHDKGYIEGDVNIAYEGDITGVAEDYNKIEYGACSFEDIRVTPKGKKALERDETILKLKRTMKEAQKNVMEGGKKLVDEGKKVIPAVASSLIVEAIKNL